MKITEATFDVDKIEKNDIGLMTLKMYLQHKNQSDKYHPSDAYDFDLEKLNRDNFTTSQMIWMGNDKFTLKSSDKGSKILKGDELVGIIIGDTLFKKKQSRYNIEPKFYLWRDEKNVKLDNVIIVKYFEDILAKIDDVAYKNISEHPVVLRRFINGGEQLTIRTTKTLTKNSGETIVILNEEGQIVSMAADEWGATLLTVAKEYRGRGLGEIIGKVWYHFNPDYTSGGYTPQGRANAIKLWKNRVRELIASGVYSELVKRGRISLDQVREIVKQVGKTEKKVIPTKQKKPDPEILVMVDDVQFIIYDKKFYDDQKSEYIYGFGFIRDLPNGDLYPYRVEWEPKFKKLATMLVFTLDKEPLEIDHSAADFLDDFEQYPEIKKKGSKATVGPNVRKMAKDLARYEEAYRYTRDKYDEIKYMLMDMANSKWD